MEHFFNFYHSFDMKVAGVLPCSGACRGALSFVSRFLVYNQKQLQVLRDLKDQNQSSNDLDEFSRSQDKHLWRVISHLRPKSLDFLLQLTHSNERLIARDHHIRVAFHILDIIFECVSIVYGDSIPKEELDRDLSCSFLLFLDWVVVGDWDQQVKFHLNWFFCKYMKQEMPEQIETNNQNGKLFFGRLDRWLKKKLLRRSQKTLIFLQTVLQGIKRGMPSLTEEQVKKSAEKHRDRLSERHETPGDLLDEVRRTASEIWGESVKIGTPTERSMISSKACYEAPRSESGALGLLLREAVIKTQTYFDDTSSSSEDTDNTPLGDCDELSEIKFSDFCLGARDDLLSEMRYSPKSGVVELRTDLDIKSVILEHRSLPKKFGPARSHTKFILEPLKVRSITKGSYRSNALYPEIQKQLWGGLQNFKQFRLTGETVNQDHVKDLTKTWSKLGLGSWTAMVSGDYSAATDCLHADVTLAALEGITSDPLTFSLMRENLCEQIISYDKNLELNEFRQQNGQLMGSIFSFPILCCANIAVYRSSMEYAFGRRFAISELPVLVNGDDILFPTTDHHYQCWSDDIKEVGFKKSVGKNFVSKDFCIINSTWYQHSEFETGDRIENYDVEHDFKFIPYINCSYLSGIKKGTDMSERDDSTWSDRLFNLKGAFRDWLGGEMPSAIGTRFKQAIKSRLDVQASRYSDFDLGLDDSVPMEMDQDNLEIFHHEFLRKEQKKTGQSKRLNPQTKFAYGLEKIALKSDSPNVPSLWKKFCRRGCKKNHTVEQIDSNAFETTTISEIRDIERIFSWERSRKVFRETEHFMNMKRRVKNLFQRRDRFESDFALEYPLSRSRESIKWSKILRGLAD